MSERPRRIGVRQAAGIAAAQDDLRARATSCDRLEPEWNAALESAFALIREAGNGCAQGANWALVHWPIHTAGSNGSRAWHGAGAGEFLDAASSLETAAWLRQQFREEAPTFLIGGSGRLAWRFSRCAYGDPAMRASERRDQRRCFGDVAADPSKHRGNARYHSKNLKQILRTRNAEAGEDYVTLRNDAS